MPADTGTPIDWIEGSGYWIVEIYCECDVETAANRFYSRKRHPGHLDSLKTPDELRNQFTILAEMGPLGVGHLIRVDTTGIADVKKLVGELSEPAA